MIKMALVTDFDGTITHNDFFHMAIDRYLKKEDLQPWYDYLAGKKSHFEALNTIFGKIRDTKKGYDELVNAIDIDEYFVPTLQLCNDKGIPVYIVSAGSDYYIKMKIGDILSQYNVKLVSNGGKYSDRTGLVMSKPPANSPFYDEKVGVSKVAVVSKLQSDGFFVIFAGDGRPDFEAAKKADVVFARSRLLEKCDEAGIKTWSFKSFQDIFDFIKEG